MSELTKDDLHVGHVYSAKSPKEHGFPPLLGDRQILWMGITKFLKWAKADITDTMPKGKWRYAR